MAKLDSASSLCFSSLKGPLTPCLDHEDRSALDKPAPKSLIEEFKNISLLPPRNETPLRHDNGVILTDSPTRMTSSATDSEESIEMREVPCDEDEPILQHNPERFCLLPIKYVLEIQRGFLNSAHIISYRRKFASTSHLRPPSRLTADTM